jgi:hypothetical protein
MREKSGIGNLPVFRLAGWKPAPLGTLAGWKPAPQGFFLENNTIVKLWERQLGNKTASGCRFFSEMDTPPACNNRYNARGFDRFHPPIVPARNMTRTQSKKKSFPQTSRL